MKNFSLCIAFMLFSTVAFAQKPRFEWGFETGVNVSKIQKFDWVHTEAPFSAPSWLLGQQVALSARYRISDNWRLRTEFLVIQKGWKGQRLPTVFDCATGMTDQQLAEITEKHNRDLRTPKANSLNYFSIPLLVEYTFLKQYLYVQAGGYWATRGPLSINTMEINDFGASLGIGAKIPLSEGLQFSFETRYAQGFSNVFKERNIGNYGSYSWDYPAEETGKGNQTLSLNVGLIFTGW